MTVEESETFKLLRLRVATEDDPGALARLLGYFQNLNITPRRIEAQFATTGLMHIQIDVCGMSEARLANCREDHPTRAGRGCLLASVVRGTLRGAPLHVVARTNAAGA